MGLLLFLTGLHIKNQAVVDNFKAVFFCDLALALFDNRIAKFNDFAGIGAHHVIVMIFARHFKNGMATFKVMTQHQAGRLKLSQYPVNSGQTNIITRFQQFLVYILSAQMML